MDRESRRRSSNLPKSPSRSLRLEQLESRYLLTAFDVLVFTKTAGFRHGSIAAGIAAVEALGTANDFSVTATEDASQFTPANLANYEAVVFLNTTGDVLNSAQEAAFEQYIQSGGGWVGVHAAADTEYGWSWYGDLLGAYFESHPATQQATVVVADQTHPSTAHLPERWVITDEWYNYQSNPRGDVHVLATLDESTYFGGTDGYDHPIAWYHDYDGGRAWYTGLGHTNGTFSNLDFRQHLLGGIFYAAGQVTVDSGATVEANYQTVELYGDSTDPMSLEVASDGRVFFVEKGGAVKRYDPVADSTSTIAQLNVYTGEEDGLLGIALDPDFDTNHWIYLFYSPAGATPKQHLSRFTLVGNQLQLNSEQVLLEVPTQRDQCCHSAGSLAFDPQGNLYLSTGDNTNPFESNGYTPIDERPGRSPWDAQKSSSNTDDLRGKILRIHPEPDGSYTIPAGNLFPADGSSGRPEIYIMGNRNPFRLSIDSETGALYWGDVGPDSNNNSASRGPRGYDEINRATSAGNYGWPYFVADNQAYVDYDFDTGQSGATFSPAAPVNDSPNNTGAVNLPPAQEPLIWYHDGNTAEFPEFGTGGRTALSGPVYHFDADSSSSSRLPGYFDETLFVYDWARRSYHEVKFDSSGDILKINPFLPETLNGVRPIDMELGPDGTLYILEWNGGFGGAPGSNLLRVEFLGAPILADFDGDGFVDGDDLSQWRGDYGIDDDSDADSDGDSDGSDFLAWQRNYAPEPPFMLPPQLGNPPGAANNFDGWNSNLMVNETDTYTNTQGVAQTIAIDSFNFYAQGTASPVTPFVARVNGDNNFTVLAIGTTRTNYASGLNSLAFADGVTPSVVLQNGETLAIGFLDANANGTGSTDAVIPFDDGGDEIWYGGGPNGSDSGSVAVGTAPVAGTNTITSFNRDYRFTIGISLVSPLQTAAAVSVGDKNSNVGRLVFTDAALERLFTTRISMRSAYRVDARHEAAGADATVRQVAVVVADVKTPTADLVRLAGDSSLDAHDDQFADVDAAFAAEFQTDRVADEISIQNV
ncbi:MAG: ThuA domain-containing protein [Planctomycetota bacterium]